MRILVATHNYPRHRGDHAGSFVARLSAATAARGHRVVVVAPHAPGAARREVLDGVQVERFRYGPDVLERVAYRGDMHRRSARDPRAVIGIPALLAAYAGAVGRAVRAFDPDIVHAHWWFPGGAIALGATRFAAGRRGGAIPVVITCHGSDVRLLDRGGIVAAAGRRVLSSAAAVTCVSQFLSRDVETAVPALAGRVRTIYMPVDPAPFVAARGTTHPVPRRILFVGNLVPGKGADVLLQAFIALRESGVACSLRIVGDGPERGRLQAAAGRSGAGDAVEWAGTVPHDRIAHEYAAAAVVVLPSRGQAEGLGLVLAEALLSGAAVVGSPAGGIPEVVVAETTGLIARDGDAAHLAVQIRRLLDDDALRARLTSAGAARVEAMFAPDSVAAAFNSVYGEVTGMRAS